MWGGSISPPRPLRNLDGDGPILVAVQALAGGLEVEFLQAFGDGADAARADGAAVDLHYRGDLEPRA